jgi:hypothetical protein
LEVFPNRPHGGGKSAIEPHHHGAAAIGGTHNLVQLLPINDQGLLDKYWLATCKGFYSIRSMITVSGRNQNRIRFGQDRVGISIC